MIIKVKDELGDYATNELSVYVTVPNIKDKKEALTNLEKLEDNMLKSGSINDIGSYSQSVKYLLNDSDKEKESKPSANKSVEYLLNYSDSAGCENSNCGQGVCASKNDKEKRLCICKEGWKGRLCDWEEEQMKKAKGMVDNGLSALKKVLKSG